MKYLNLFCLLFAISMYAMDKSAAGNAAQLLVVPPCDCAKTKQLQEKFEKQGFNAHRQKELLDRLVNVYEESYLPTIQALICASKHTNSKDKGERWIDNGKPAAFDAFRLAVQKNNFSVVHSFLQYFKLGENFPNLCCYEKYHKAKKPLAEILVDAINTSEEMTKLMIENGINPLSSFIMCTDEPGCKYYKNAFDQAVKNLVK